MTASILFEPVDPNPERIPSWAPSSFMQAMEAAGIGLPCHLDEKHIPKLQGMAATWHNKESPNPYQGVIDAIEKYGLIRIWAEY